MEIKIGSKFDKTPEGFVRIDISTTAKSKYAPRKEDLEAFKAGKITWEEYAQRYRGFLEVSYQADPKFFDDILENEKVFLVCYEKDDRYCHRRLLANFLREYEMV